MSEETGAWSALIRADAGVVNPPHKHLGPADFYVLSGSLTIELDGRRETLSPFEGLEVAPGLPHQVFNASGDDAEFLVVSQPTSRGDRVEAPASPA